VCQCDIKTQYSQLICRSIIHCCRSNCTKCFVKYNKPRQSAYSPALFHAFLPWCLCPTNKRHINVLLYINYSLNCHRGAMIVFISSARQHGLTRGRGAVGRASDLRFIGRGMLVRGTLVRVQPRHYCEWPWASYSHLCASVTKQELYRQKLESKLPRTLQPYGGI